jgi:hypothetical protein
MQTRSAQAAPWHQRRELGFPPEKLNFPPLYPFSFSYVYHHGRIHSLRALALPRVWRARC